MKRYLFSCTITLIGLIGFLLIMGGFHVLASMPADPANPANPVKDNWQRVASIGMLVMGFDCLLWRKSNPDYLPEWYKRRLLLYLSFLWIIVGVIIFILSWF